MRMVGDAWKALPAAEKQKYYTASEVDRDRYTKDV